MELKEVNCMDCGKKITARMNRAVCEDCRLKRRIETNKRNVQKLREVRRLIREKREIFCVICGERIVNAYPTTKYCNVCENVIVRK